MRAMAGAEPSAVIAGAADRDATKVGADTENNEPLGLECAILVGLLIAEVGHGNGRLGGDL